MTIRHDGAVGLRAFCMQSSRPHTLCSLDVERVEQRPRSAILPRVVPYELSTRYQVSACLSKFGRDGRHAE